MKIKAFWILLLAGTFLIGCSSGGGGGSNGTATGERVEAGVEATAP